MSTVTRSLIGIRYIAIPKEQILRGTSALHLMRYLDARRVPTALSV